MPKEKLHEPSLIANLLISERNAVEDVRFVADLQPEDFSDPKLRKAYEVILDAYQQGLSPNPKVVHTVSNKLLDLDWLESLAEGAEFLMPTELISHAKLIVQEAEIRGTSKVLVGGLQAIESSRDIALIKADLVNHLTHTRSGNTKDSSISAILARHQANPDSMLVTPTHLPWLDEWLKGGLRSGRFMAIAGPQGGRKSTWARNVVLGAARNKRHEPRQNVTIAWMAFENDQQISSYDFVAMLAVEWLRENGKYDEKIDGKLIREVLDAETISYAIRARTLDKWPATARQAITVGIETASKYPITIYDSAIETGNLVSQTALWRCVHAHHFNYVKDDKTHLIVVIDYAQLVRETGRLYEDMELLSRDCLQVVARLNCTIILLSQFNESYNRDVSKGEQGKGWQGIKGGGDIKAGVQNLMTVEYDDEVSPNTLRVKSGKARRGKTTTGYAYTIDPTSGLVLS